MEKENQVLYESLGAPSLLHRHAPSYTLLHESTRKAPSVRDAARWKADFLSSRRVKARFFDTTVELTAKKQRVVEDEVPPLPPQGGSPPNSLGELQGMSGVQYDVEQDSRVLEEIRKAMFPNNPALSVTMRKLDQTYQLANLGRRFGHRFAKEVVTCQREIAIERTNASPEYLAPFSSNILLWGLSDELRAQPSEPEHCKEERRGHGNCLASFRCPCCKSTRCLMHPSGDMLSTLCVSTLELPQESGLIPFADKHTKAASRHEIEIGEPILQICECSQWKTGIGYFLVRTSNYSTVVSIESTGNCMFHIKSVRRLDLRSMSNSAPSFRPIYATAHQRYGSDSFTKPLIAVVSRLDRARTVNVVHCGIDPPVMHTIENLQNIDLVEFSGMHPMILHSAATSFMRPALVDNFVSRRPTLGLGSSLYTTDLRSNQATFQWSPSAEEFVTECVHSISGFMSDVNKENSLFVASISAAKCWEIDSRMPYRALDSWSLPGLCQSMGVNTHCGDLHGGWTLLHQPRDEYRDGVLYPFLSVDTSVESFDFCVYQRPVTRPLLECQSLELLSGPSFKGVSATRSSVFPLPDVSSRVFTCGITSFRDSVSRFLDSRQCKQLDLANPPSMALSVITMTNVGDLYNSVLLEFSDHEMTRATNPAAMGGNKSLSVAALFDDGKPALKSFIKRREGGYKMRTVLGDFPATPNSKLTKTIVETRSDCEPFVSIPLHEIRRRGVGVTRRMGREKGQRDDTDVYHTASRQPIVSGSNGILTSSSDQLSRAIDDLRSSTNESIPRSEESGRQGLVALGKKIWTQTSPNF